MILGFSTHINRKPTLFTNKIVKAIWQLFPNQMNELASSQAFPDFYVYEEISIFEQEKLNPKLHTIREDKTNRWKAGMKIDFFINCRQKNMFRFAPVLPVVSVQEVFMTKRGNDLEITLAKADSYIGGNDFYLYYESKKELALNDGFDSYEDFRDYFFERIEDNFKSTKNNWFTGKIIHWTDLKY